MLFKLYGLNLLTSKNVSLLYSNSDNSYSFDMDMLETNEAPFTNYSLRKSHDHKQVRNIKLMLGQVCNYSCSYCEQSHQNSKAHLNKYNNDDYLGFVKYLADSMTQHSDDVVLQLWGGEPLLYIKQIKELIRLLSEYKINDRVKLYMITNGALLNYELNKFFDENNFAISISHDAQGQFVRHKQDFLDTPHKAIIEDLMSRLIPKGLFSFNVVITKNNQSREAIIDFFETHFPNFKNQINIGEGDFVKFGSELDKIVFGYEKKYNDYRLDMLARFQQNVMEQFPQIAGHLESFKKTLMSNTATPVKSCNSVYSNWAILDPKLNYYSCQNSGANIIDNISNDCALDHNTYFGLFDHCKQCPVLHSCKSRCPLENEKLNLINCDFRFNDAVVLFVQAFKELENIVIYKIECLNDNVEQKEDRKYIFGDLSKNLEMQGIDALVQNF